MGAVRPVGRSVPTEAELKKEKLRIWKNVLVVSLSIMGLFTAQGVVAVLQVSKEYYEIKKNHRNPYLLVTLNRARSIAKPGWVFYRKP